MVLKEQPGITFQHQACRRQANCEQQSTLYKIGLTTTHQISLQQNCSKHPHTHPDYKLYLYGGYSEFGIISLQNEGSCTDCTFHSVYPDRDSWGSWIAGNVACRHEGGISVPLTRTAFGTFKEKAFTTTEGVNISISDRVNLSTLLTLGATEIWKARMFPLREPDYHVNADLFFYSKS